MKKLQSLNWNKGKFVNWVDKFILRKQILMKKLRFNENLTHCSDYFDLLGHIETGLTDISSIDNRLTVCKFIKNNFRNWKSKKFT